MSQYAHLDKEALIRLLERRDAERQLGLVWEREEIDTDAALNADFVAFDLDETLSHSAAPWDNLIIEGDNYDALRALRMTHAGRIRCIYIDPPYNTGNRDFVYNDRFVDKTHRFRHSLWLEFMYRRLVLARDLLADDGVIFVSIDDNELFRLGMLMDRVFGEDNKLATFIWETDGTFDNQATIKISHEYILCFARDANRFEHPKIIDPNIESDSKLFRAEIRNSIIKNGPRNPISDVLLPAGFPAEFDAGELPARTDAWPHFDRAVTVAGGKTLGEVIVRSGWANKRLLEDFIRNRFEPILDGKAQRTRFALTKTGAIENVKARDVPSYVLSVLRNFGNVRAESNELARMGVDFKYPKPARLIEYFASIINDQTATFLDFFAGSGTTAHAVAKLNAEDGGTRRFILVSSTEATDETPDKNLCRDVCATRVRRVLGGYTNAKGETVEGLGGGFAYLRTRRIAPHRLSTRIAHAQVWHALQLIHARALSLWRDSGFQHDETLGYLADFRVASLDALSAWLGDSRGAGRTIYCWTPERIADLAPEADLAPIPDFLRQRFGR